MLEINDLHFAYRYGREVLNGASISLEKGGILCLLGSNGVGKTTLIRCLLGFHKPTSGTMFIDSQDLAKMPPAKRAHYMAYVPQSSNLAFPYTAKEVVLMGRTSHLSGASGHTDLDHEISMACMDRLQISHLADRRFQELSGGERQMVLVARALAQDAKLLVMDEPTSALDYHNQVKILAAIKCLAAQGLSILMTSHYPDHAFLACTKAALMKNGQVISIGEPNRVVTTESLTNLYDTPVHVAFAEADGFRIKTCIPLLDESSFSRTDRVQEIMKQKERNYQ